MSGWEMTALLSLSLSLSLSVPWPTVNTVQLGHGSIWRVILGRHSKREELQKHRSRRKKHPHDQNGSMHANGSTTLGQNLHLLTKAVCLHAHHNNGDVKLFAQLLDEVCLVEAPNQTNKQANAEVRAVKHCSFKKTANKRGQVRGGGGTSCFDSDAASKGGSSGQLASLRMWRLRVREKRAIGLLLLTTTPPSSSPAIPSALRMKRVKTRTSRPSTRLFCPHAFHEASCVCVMYVCLCGVCVCVVCVSVCYVLYVLCVCVCVFIQQRQRWA